MATRERPIDRGRRLARLDLARMGSEIRTARLILGRSIESTSRAAGMSSSQGSRIERAELATASVDQLARLGATVGLDVRVRAYPGPDPSLDAGQLALIGRLQARLPQGVTLRIEQGLPIAGDQRAWDGILGGLAGGPRSTLPFDAETRLVDVQAQVRRVLLKGRDSGHEHVILLVARTHANRAALATAAPALAADFPIGARSALAALREGRHPGGSTVILL